MTVAALSVCVAQSARTQTCGCVSSVLHLIKRDGPQASRAPLSTHASLISSPATDRDHVFLVHTKQVIYMTRDLFTLLRGREEGDGGRPLHTGNKTRGEKRQNKRKGFYCDGQREESALMQASAALEIKGFQHLSIECFQNNLTHSACFCSGVITVLSSFNGIHF